MGNETEPPQSRSRSPTEGVQNITAMKYRSLREVGSMLKLTLKQGEYITISDDVVVQYERTLSDCCRLMITAPKDVAVLRGAVLERDHQRPDCVAETSRSVRQSVPWNNSKTEILSRIYATLDAMEKRDSRAAGVKRLLNALFPADMLREIQGTAAK